MTGPSGPVRRRRWWHLALPALVVAGLVALVAVPGGGGDGGEAAPAFSLPTVERPDRTISLADYRGTPVVLNFWAAWCVPCRKELPVFQEVAARLGGKVAFVGVDHQDSRDAARALLADTGVGYPSAFDPTGSVAQAFRLFGMPTTVFVSSDGRVLKKRTGELDRDELEGTIRDLFGVAPP